MKYQFVIYLILMCMRPVLPVLNYTINYSYISKNLCENKQKPTLNCNGKCYLKKQLASTPETDKTQQKDKKNTTFEYNEEYTTKTLDFLFFFINPFKKTAVPPYNVFYNYLNIVFSFHPPI